jgi:DNA-binding NarL/FixJ family response regulator
MAESVEQAFECLAARAAPFELVLSDVVMPGRPARELLYALRARQPETRILFTSGYSPASIHQHGIELDAQCFLAKPFTAASLLEAVRGAIDGEPPAALVASEGRGFGSLSP